MKESLLFDDGASADFDLKSDDFLCQECEWSSEDKQRKALETQQSLMAELTQLKKKSILFRFNFDLLKIILDPSLKAIGEKPLGAETDPTILIQEFLNDKAEYFDSPEYNAFLKNLKLISKFNTGGVSKSRIKKNVEQSFEEKDFEIVRELQSQRVDGACRMFNDLQEVLFDFRYNLSCTDEQGYIPMVFHTSPWRFHGGEFMVDFDGTSHILKKERWNYLKMLEIYLSNRKYRDSKLDWQSFNDIYEHLRGESSLIQSQELKFGLVLLKEELRDLDIEKYYEEGSETEFCMGKMNRKNSTLLIQRNIAFLYNPFISGEREEGKVNEKDKKQELDEMLDFENKSKGD